jgi:hypothetical protein
MRLELCTPGVIDAHIIFYVLIHIGQGKNDQKNFFFN